MTNNELLHRILEELITMNGALERIEEQTRGTPEQIDGLMRTLARSMEAMANERDEPASIMQLLHEPDCGCERCIDAKTNDDDHDLGVPSW